MSEVIINKTRYECPPAVAAYIKELKTENARFKELYQKLVGVIAATDCVECQAWIDASIRLPDDNGDVLVWYQCKCCGKTSQSLGITFCSRGDWYKKHLDGECINVLFWHKLPKPPTRECDTKMDGGAKNGIDARLFHYRARLELAKEYADRLLSLLSELNSEYTPDGISNDELEDVFKRLDELDTLIDELNEGESE